MKQFLGAVSVNRPCGGHYIYVFGSHGTVERWDSNTNCWCAMASTSYGYTSGNGSVSINDMQDYVKRQNKSVATPRPIEDCAEYDIIKNCWHAKPVYSEHTQPIKPPPANIGWRNFDDLPDSPPLDSPRPTPRAKPRYEAPAEPEVVPEPVDQSIRPL